MKFYVFSFLFLSLQALGIDVNLVMTCESGQANDIGNSYRLYAVIPLDASLHVVYGSNQYPLWVKSTSSFFQHPMGSNTSSGIHPALENSQPDLSRDSWITIGYENQTNNHLWDVGLDLETFSQGNGIYCDNGGWFLVPTDPRCLPNDQGLILLAQFTSSGVVSGVLNLQGRNAEGVWNKTALSFSSENCLIPGCTDSQFMNFNPSAQINDGSCTGNADDGIIASSPESDWTVFPNPLRENLFHIQFNEFQFPSASPCSIEIRDGSGKIILNRSILPETMKDVNRLTIEHQLAPGSYEVILYQDNFRQFKKLVVVR